MISNFWSIATTLVLARVHFKAFCYLTGEILKGIHTLNVSQMTETEKKSLGEKEV